MIHNTTTNKVACSIFPTKDTANLNFAQNAFYSEFTDHLTLTDTAKALPDMQGSGLVRVNNQNFINTRRMA